jgi:putative ATP-binding cassette transporter
MQILFLLFRTSRTDVVIAALAGVAGGLATSGFALVLQSAIAVRGEDSLRHILAFVICWIAYGVGSVVTANRITRVSQRAIRELRVSLSRQILEMPLARLEREGSRIFPVLTEDVQVIAWAAENMPATITGLVTVIGCLAILLTISCPLTLACIFLLVLALALYSVPLARFTRHLDRWRSEWDKISVHIDSLVHGQKELLLDIRKRHALLTRHIEPTARRQESEMVPASTWETLLRRWGEMLLLLGVGILLFTMPLHGLATYEQFGRFLFVALFILAPLSTISGVGTLLRRANIAANRARELGVLLGAPPPVQPPPSKAYPSSFIPFSLRDVTYDHLHEEGNTFVLGPVSLAFDRPEIVFICGGNGSGKTTLLKLLCGLYAPASGAIHLDGHPLDSADFISHRQRFAAIFSDLHLFSSLLGYEDASPELANQLLATVDLAKRVSVDASGGFSTTALSQGQRKRLALVAALLEDKPVYIFDEWAADQDPEFRRLFYDKFLPDLRDRGRLVIAITHDEGYYDRCDRLIRLGDGRILADERPSCST